MRVYDKPRIVTLGDTDFVMCYSNTESDTVLISMGNFMEQLRGELGSNPFFSQYAAPAATGFSISVNDDTLSVRLIITPLAGYAAGTIVLPTKTKCVHGQTIKVNCTQAVTTLTINGNGATVVGAPTTLAANAYFVLEYESVTGTWYRVG